jgi:drug/metabolite transporter (DMT)-like permease
LVGPLPSCTATPGVLSYVEGNLTFRSFLLLLFNLILGSFGQLCLKEGLPRDLTKNSTSLLDTLTRVLHAMMNPYVLLGLGLYVLSVFTWILLLSKVRLSVAYPMISISYFFVVALSVLILHEHVHWVYAASGLALISAGVTFIGVGMGQASAEKQ